MTIEQIDEELFAEYVREADRLIMASIPPEKELKHKFSRRFERKMRALLKYERRSVPMRRFVSGMKRAAAAIIIVMGLGLALTMGVNAYRIDLIQMVTEVFDNIRTMMLEYEDITFIKSTKVEPDEQEELGLIEPEYVPDGYEVEERISGPFSLMMTYVNENESNLVYKQTSLGYGEIMLDTEDAEIDTEEIGDYEVTIISKNNNYISYWRNSQFEFWVNGNISKEEILRMTESIIQQSENQ